MFLLNGSKSPAKINFLEKGEEKFFHPAGEAFYDSLNGLRGRPAGRSFQRVEKTGCI